MKLNCNTCRIQLILTYDISNRLISFVHPSFLCEKCNLWRVNQLLDMSFGNNKSELYGPNGKVFKAVCFY